MKLHVDDETVEAPTLEDLRRLVPDHAPHEDWSLALERADGFTIEAEATIDERYEVSYAESGTLFIAEGALDGSQLRALLQLFLNGDDTWRSRATWKPWKPPQQGAGTPNGNSYFSLKFAGLAVGVLALIYVGQSALEWFGNTAVAHIRLPAALDSIAAQMILGFFGLVVAVFVVALVFKLIETRKAAKWPRVMGRIVGSEAGLEERRSAGDALPRAERVARITYTYDVGEESYRGTRFTLAEKVAESEVPEVLARYPAGKIVPVFYDPADPANAVLERDAPSGLLLGCLGLLVAGGVAVAVLMVLVTQGPDWILTVLPNSVPALVILPGLGGLLVAMLGLATVRTTRSALGWPTVQGQIMQSEVVSGGVGKGYRPVVEYAYSVKGRDYRSRSVILDTVVGGSRGYAERRASRYPVGRTVKVFHDPRDPGRAALEIHSGTGWWILGLGFALLAVALTATGLF